MRYEKYLFNLLFWIRYRKCYEKSDRWEILLKKIGCNFSENVKELSK